MAVIRDEMIVSTNAISPGTNRLELSRVGLNRVRTCALMIMARGLSAWRGAPDGPGPRVTNSC